MIKYYLSHSETNQQMGVPQVRGIAAYVDIETVLVCGAWNAYKLLYNVDFISVTFHFRDCLTYSYMWDVLENISDLIFTQMLHEV
jgi:hypothetical protein